MNITIRRAERKDCKRIRELVHELAVYEKAPHEITISDKDFEESGFGEKPVWWAFVAELDGKVEAFALYYIRFSTWKGPRLYLEDILVTEKMRGNKIGEKLFNSIIEEAKQKKYNGVVWQVLNWNEPAINFYKKFNAKFDGEWMNAVIDFE
jgi:Sortase and related acyltransferases